MLQEISNRIHFRSATLRMLPLALSVSLAGTLIVAGMTMAAPRQKAAIDRSLIADGPKRLGPTAEVQAASRAYVAALQQGHGQTIASFWTARGVYIDSSGQSFPARELAIREFHEPVPKDAGTAKTDANPMPMKPGTIHWVTLNVALERGTTTQRVTETGETTEVRYLAIWVQEGTRWLLACLQETAGLQDTPGKNGTDPNGAGPGKLDELKWLVGQWRTLGAEPMARLSVQWSADKKYLVQKFQVDLPGQQRIHGHQRLAWDPRSNQIRSWIFRSDGGFAESIWSREGDTWIVKTQGTDASGAQTSAVDLWAPDGLDCCWFKSLRLSEDKTSSAGTGQDEVILHFQRIEE